MEFLKNLETKINLRNLRNGIQILFAVFLVYVAWRFYGFIRYFESNGATEFIKKPGAVEAFLPVSALMSFKIWLTEGMFDPFHPAGLVIFTTILVVSFFFKKGFCSWICPIGTLSEGLWRLGNKVFKNNIVLPKILDYVLMSLKYLILAFFVKVIVIDMPSMAIVYFLQGEYNLIADVKMLKFFASPSQTTLIVLGGLVVLSILIKNFWCRYLCPYGALLGLLSLASPWKITREETECINCDLCTKACPNEVKVSTSKVIFAPECHSCLDCIHVCPKEKALGLKLFGKSSSLKPILFPALLFAVWFGIIGYAKLTGNWDSQIPVEVLKELIPNADTFNH